jgi:hypothetical protein
MAVKNHLHSSSDVQHGCVRHTTFKFEYFCRLKLKNFNNLQCEHETELAKHLIQDGVNLTLLYSYCFTVSII